MGLLQSQLHYIILIVMSDTVNYRVIDILRIKNYALYYMNALLMDKPDPGESLFSNIVWAYSEENIKLSVNEKSISSFHSDQSFTEDHLLKGKEGSFLCYINKSLNPDDKICWYIIADVQKSQSDISKILLDVKQSDTVKEKIDKSIQDNNNAFEKTI